MKPNATELLALLIERRGSDLHLVAGLPPMIRVAGEFVQLEEYDVLISDTIKELIYSLLTDAQRHALESDLELDCSLAVQGLSRFRVNIHYQNSTLSAVIRAIPYKIPSIEELGLPRVTRRLCERPNGLVLVTGPTGSGKSTTLAAMIDYINDSRREHILTIEDPIEFRHAHKNCIVRQRELHADTKSFPEALRRSLRQDPDVVLIGELRDLETIESALRVAETGHLTFATLHTNSAASTINRIIDVFPEGQQAQVRTQLSMVLEGVLSQALLPRADGAGRVMALEVLVPTPAIRNLVRENKVHQIYSMMQAGQEANGMQTFNQSLAELLGRGLISKETALHRTPNPDELRELIDRNPGGGGPALNFVRPGAGSRPSASSS